MDIIIPDHLKEKFERLWTVREQLKELQREHDSLDKELSRKLIELMREQK